MNFSELIHILKKEEALMVCNSYSFKRDYLVINKFITA